MLPPKLKLSPQQQHLLRLFDRLSATQRDQLLDFAEFLAGRADGADAPMPAEPPREPQAIPRPESETVIAAIRRLSATYPMLERDELLHETSALMTAHVMQGRTASDVIDDMENLFRLHYERRVSGIE